MNVTREEYAKIEARFRLWAFGVYYNRTFAEERDPTVRFVKALVSSAQPIEDRQAVLAWSAGCPRRQVPA